MKGFCLTIRTLTCPRVIAFGAILVIFCATAWGADSNQEFFLDDAATGRVFEGVGAVSGGGGTSVLLKDYPEPQRSQILDMLFKPQFGASMQTLYVEIGGDGNSTQGSEPSHMHTRADQNYFRGYEWWLMAEAKKRNPDLTLDGCAWSCPGWIGDGNFWSQDMADYYVNWIKGLKRFHGMDLDAIGCRNERGAVTDWVKLFRRTLDSNGLSHVRIHGFDNPGNKYMWDWIPQLTKDKDLVNSVDVISNHTLLLGDFPDSVRVTIARFNKPIWNTEEHVYNGEGRFYRDDYDCALAAVHLFNEDFISRGATKIVNWYLVGSTYPTEPYADQPPALIARSPWSGHYSIKPILWSYAHYGQFTHIGWRYIESACGNLAGGGSVVALKSDAGDFSIIIETADANSTQRVVFRRASGLKQKALCVWETTRDLLFTHMADLTPDTHGEFSLMLDPNAIYSISTMSGQQKGAYEIPPDKPFPFPYCERFDHYQQPERWGYLPHFTADICGGFEIADRPDGLGKCLRQVIDRKAQSWAPEWMPYTVIGDERWRDCEVSADIFLDEGGWAGLMGRVNNTGNGWDGNPNGYYARLYADGGCALYRASDSLKGSRDRQLALGAAMNWKANRWHNLKLRFQDEKITVLVDGERAVEANDPTYSRGQAGLITAGEGTDRNSALFANLLINKIDGGDIRETSIPQTEYPLYAH
jgi:galactosylceramidase